MDIALQKKKVHIIILSKRQENISLESTTNENVICSLQQFKLTVHNYRFRYEPFILTQLCSVSDEYFVTIKVIILSRNHIIYGTIVNEW